ncbi:nuclease-related domain-containing protein [Halomonas heilongjiangensis]|uniref:Nuclease n=1 Tax=Halomonas heilongjiangensis TaxID=1387883 RepID=A0A2N7TFY0_9GAMM|nr:NERD domain-containing protein [Halomonas heilongjiangensis]PMR67091.1 nuclease [Halomonas heilongjiangensis]PXX87828.1 nuclease [Halomonas heilongjiangensis]
MDSSLIINEATRVLWWLIPLLILIGVFKSPWFKGIVGETLVKMVAKFRLSAETYHRVHNVTLLTPDGTTQIDHIFVSRFGIFVVETKNMKGWIFGGEKQAQWTQKLYRKSFKFQNPLRQNYKHVKALEAALDVPSDAIHSVVVFTGNSTFKSKMPANVTVGGGYVNYIKSFREVVLSEAQVQDALKKIQTGRLSPSRETHRQHVVQLKARSDPSADRKCPKCGSSMVLRTAKRGTSAGKKFWGCSAYPQCRMMQNVI